MLHIKGHPSTSSFIESLWKGMDKEKLAGIPARTPTKPLKILKCMC